MNSRCFSSTLCALAFALCLVLLSPHLAIAAPATSNSIGEASTPTVETTAVVEPAPLGTQGDIAQPLAVTETASFEINDLQWEKTIYEGGSDPVYNRALGYMGANGNTTQSAKALFSWKAPGVAGETGAIPAGQVVIKLPSLLEPRANIKDGAFAHYRANNTTFGEKFVKVSGGGLSTGAFKIEVAENGDVTLTNQQAIEPGTTGSFEIEYIVEPRLYNNGYIKTNQPTYTVNGVAADLPDLTLTVGNTVDPYEIAKTHKPFKPASSDPDFYWSEYTVSVDRTAVWGHGYDSFYIYDVLDPALGGQVVSATLDGKALSIDDYSADPKFAGWSGFAVKLTPDQMVYDAVSPTTQDIAMDIKVIVKFPKANIDIAGGGTKTIGNTVHLYGTEWGRTDSQFIVTSKVSHNFDDYNFTYWDGIDLNKRSYSAANSSSRANTDFVSTEAMIRPDGSSFTYQIGALNPWDRAEPYDLAIYDDFMDLKNAQGTYVQLKDSEYHFDFLSINPQRITNLDGTPLAKSYDYEVWVRKVGDPAGTYPTKAFTNTTSANGQHGGYLPTGTVGFKFVIKNVDQAMDFGNEAPNFLQVKGAVTLTPERAKDVLVSTVVPPQNSQDAYLRNLTFLELYEPNGDVVPFDLTEANYTGTSGPRVAQRDLDTYGHYVFRRLGDVHVIGGQLEEYVYKGFGKVPYKIASDGSAGRSYPAEFNTNEEKQQFEGFTQIEAGFGVGSSISGYTAYDILPLGMKFDTEKGVDAVQFASANRNRADLLVINADGTQQTVKNADIPAYLKQHAIVKVTPDYKGSGRDMVEVAVDFGTAKVTMASDAPRFISAIPTKVSFVDSEKVGRSFKNDVALITKDVPSTTTRLRPVKNDDGSILTGADQALWSDLDGDGQTTNDPDKVIAGNNTILFPSVALSEQAPSKQVEHLDGTYKKNPDIAEVIEGNDFHYRLSFGPKISDLSNIVVYDELPAIGDVYFDADAARNSEWTPQLKSIDTAALEALGIQPVVYYSTQTKPGLLKDASGTVQPQWSTTQPADMTTVKAVAIDIAKKKDGTDFVLKQGETITVELLMNAPAGHKDWYGKIAHNTFYYEKSAYDSVNKRVIGKILPSESNNTSIHYAPANTDVTVTKRWSAPEGEAGTQAVIDLLADGAVKDTVTLDAKSDWTHTFTDLPRTKVVDGKLQAIEYSVQEHVVDGFTATVTGDATQGFVVLNTANELVSFPVKKVWATSNGEPGADSVTVDVMGSGNVVKTIELSAANSWQGIAEGLPKFDEKGQLIEYTVVEHAVSGFVSEVTGSTDDGFVVTNKPEESIPPQSSTSEDSHAGGTVLPRTSDATGNMGWLLAIGIVVMGIGAGTLYRSRK